MATNRRPRRHRNPYDLSVLATCTWTVGAEAGNAIVVTGQLKKSNSAVLGQRVALRTWLSDVNTGAGVCAVAPSGAVAISGGFGAILVSPTAKLINDLVTDATGKFALTITEAGVKTLYVCALLPDGSISVSGAVTFA